VKQISSERRKYPIRFILSTASAQKNSNPDSNFNSRWYTYPVYRTAFAACIKYSFNNTFELRFEMFAARARKSIDSNNFLHSRRYKNLTEAIQLQKGQGGLAHLAKVFTFIS